MLEQYMVERRMKGPAPELPVGQPAAEKPAAETPLLELEGVSQRYGEHWVLKRVSFSFTAGKVYGIIGPNGAGKSTLLRIMTAMEKPREGRVFWEGQPLHQPAGDITCMWQKPYLFQSRVRDNILYGLKIRGWPQAQQEKRLSDILERFRLADISSKFADRLSGGEGARVALARAVAPRPRLLVLDEPAANLDPAHTLSLETALLEICAEEGLTVVMVTHDMFQAKRVAHETLFLSEGVLEEWGPTAQIFHHPQAKKTRRFISGEL